MTAELFEEHRQLQGLVAGSSVPTARSANAAKLSSVRRERFSAHARPTVAVACPDEESALPQ